MSGMNRAWIMLGILIIIGGGIWLVSNMNKTNQITAPSIQQPVGGGPNTSNIKSFNVTGMPFSFNPSEIRVKKGDTVRITFTSKEGMHSFGIDEFNVRTKTVGPEESDTVEFVADKTGTFQYFCNVDSHRDQGMVGNLIVE